MRKFALWSTTVFVCILAAGCYGALHNQLTYSLSPEYFTEFKFPQFKIETEKLGGNRLAAGIVGFLASWWMGALVAIILGSTALVSRDYSSLKKIIRKGIVLVFCTTALVGLAGFVSGPFIDRQIAGIIYFPSGVTDKVSFTRAAIIHDASYLGAVLGIVIAETWLLFRLWQERHSRSIHHFQPRDHN